ncbi:manganese efflux pump MntP [Effusibacillus dendaii]|uniref:Putative manganese efflux pump MntP n=1 Tax=Effusibacillus dendaii TaxID=2743772 RepID=A0A7I8DC39_9BACL|nr:manganese efflux pump MntP family protein [Effusibacillus dendaii]BCJ87665.1 putative manganese efflux pump MntP [Effusibacillus dendaii]
MAEIKLSEFITIFTTAVALGSDAMSIGIGLGMQRLTKRDIFRVSSTVGLFHVIMPLIGMGIGLYLYRLMGDVAKVIGSILLIGFGAHMIWDAWKGNDEPPKFAMNRSVGIGLFLFALSVSIDAMSVGFSFGLSDAKLGLTVLIFGVVGAIMTAIGLSIGNVMGRVLGDSMTIIGGGILIFFGIQFLL